jgi:hypothetical protein
LGKRSRKQSTDENDQETAPHGESHVTASAGSNENLDNLDEDLMRDRGSRATGYVGQNSEVQWLRSVQRQSEQTGAALRDQPYGPPGSSRDAASARSDALRKRRDIAKENFREGSMKHITDSTFYLDSEDIEFDIVVDPNEDPEPDVAERLFNCYLETVHPSFPLVRRPMKSLQYNINTYFMFSLIGTYKFRRSVSQVLGIAQAKGNFGGTSVVASPDEFALRHRSKVLSSRRFPVERK